MEKKTGKEKERKNFQVNQVRETERESLPIVAVTHFHMLLSLFCE